VLESRKPAMAAAWGQGLRQQLQQKERSALAHPRFSIISMIKPRLD
jgi:hypothetical protein